VRGQKRSHFGPRGSEVVELTGAVGSAVLQRVFDSAHSGGFAVRVPRQLRKCECFDERDCAGIVGSKKTSNPIAVLRNEIQAERPELATCQDDDSMASE
jgi:hypothetical protein